MNDGEKTKEYLLTELIEARKRIADLEFIELLHKHIEKELERSEGKYRSLVDSTDDSIYVVDRECKYLFINKKHLSRLEIAKNSYAGKRYSEFHTPVETEDFLEKVKAVFQTGQSLQHEYRALRDDKYFLRTLSPVRSPDGNVTAVTVISKDIDERKRMEEELRALSLTDELTGLYNRRGFFTLAKQQLRIASRLQRYALLFSADMDHLKKINDTYGHQAGDQALIEAADIIKKTFRESDVIARIGGDEFVVFMIEHTDIDAEQLAGRMQDILTSNNSQGKRPYTLSLSIGAVRYDPQKPSTLDELMAQADKMMYEQKRMKMKEPL